MHSYIHFYRASRQSLPFPTTPCSFWQNTIVYTFQSIKVQKYPRWIELQQIFVSSNMSQQSNILFFRTQTTNAEFLHHGVHCLRSFILFGRCSVIRVTKRHHCRILLVSSSHLLMIRQTSIESSNCQRCQCSLALDRLKHFWSSVTEIFIVRAVLSQVLTLKNLSSINRMQEL